MTINDYIGRPYDALNVNGFNCWSFVASVYLNVLRSNIVEYELITGSPREMASVFAAALATGSHKLTQIDRNTVKDYDIVLFNSKRNYHVGLWFGGKVVHCSSGGGGVVIQSLEQAQHGFKEVTFWQR